MHVFAFLTQASRPDRWTNRWTDKASDRVNCQQLKQAQEGNSRVRLEMTDKMLKMSGNAKKC